MNRGSTAVTATRSNSLVGLLVVVGTFFVVRFAGRATGIPFGGPISSVAALVAIAFVIRAEGGSWASVGLGKPRKWSRALITFLLAFALTAATGLLLLSYLFEVFGAPEPSGRFDYLQNNLPALLISVVGIAWFAAAFGEEVVWRGFVLPRLAYLLGDGPPALLAAVVIQAVIFGVLHHGTAGAIAAGVIGLVYGLLFWLGERNLWPLIVAHAIPDTISFVSTYQGG